MFNGERLTYARNRVGLSMQEIADCINVQRQYIHKIETDKENKSLSATQIEIIADFLGVYPEFFSSENTKRISNDKLHFRSVAIPKYVQEQAKIVAEDVVSVCQFIRDFIAPLGLSFPIFDLDEKIDSNNIQPDSLDVDEIESITTQLREILNLGGGPISNMVRILETQGIVVATAPEVSSKVDAFCNDDFFPVVVRNNTKSGVRCRFDLAHELAHLTLHKGITNDIIKYPEIENQANYFASSLLLPRSTFVSEFPRFNNSRVPWNALIAMKKRWRVSIASIITRAFHLGIIDNYSYKRAFVGLSTKGWRTNEPLDDKNEPDYIEQEQPELLQNAVKMIMNTHQEFLPKMREALKLKPELIKQIIDMDDLDSQRFFREEKPFLSVVK